MLLFCWLVLVVVCVFVFVAVCVFLLSEGKVVLLCMYVEEVEGWGLEVEEVEGWGLGVWDWVWG